jgi:DNA-directed RNA polymerase alpha subunit
MPVRKFGLSKRVVDVLFDEERLIFLNQLIIMGIYTREDLLEIEGLEEKDKEEIVRKIEEFVNNSWALTALFYCNFEKLKVKPWWCRLIVYISRKRKDPAFLFISELRLSTRITSFLMEEKIYTIEDLLIIIKDTHSSKWRRFVQSEELAYIDLIEIYTTVHNFLHC